MKVQYKLDRKKRYMFKIFAIFDKKALCYSAPFFCRNKAEALRSLDDLVNNPETRINRHPADYNLWMLGEWDDVTAVLVPLSKPEFLDEAGNLLKTKGELQHA